MYGITSANDDVPRIQRCHFHRVHSLSNLEVNPIHVVINKGFLIVPISLAP